MSRRNRFAATPRWRAVLLGTLLLVPVLGATLASCSGSTGSAGGAGPAGASTPSAPGLRAITSATAITGRVTAVAISGPPVVSFTLVDQDGVALTGLPAGDIAFGVAKLVPPQNGSSSYWSSYIYGTVKPSVCPVGVAACATTPRIQANIENGALGALVDNGDGSYVYTFKQDITHDPLVAFDPVLTHRVAFEIRGLAPANNGALTFEPDTGATTGIAGRELVDTATCDGCHTRLNAHGGARVDVQYCVMCHNPGTADPNSGNSLDMQVMVHKVHAGSSLPSISNYVTGTSNPTPILGQGYWIVGYGDSLNNFNTVVYPQDTRNCTTCHAQDHAALTQAANYKTVPTREACGACHDNINFATGLNHSSGIIADDTQCATCHGANSAIDGGKLQVVTAHVIPVSVYQAKFSYNLLGATNTGPGQTPVIHFSITDPTNGNRPWNLVSDEPFTYCAAGTTNPSIAIAWSTTDYTNVGSGVTSEVAEPIAIPVACALSNAPTALGDGTYSVSSPTALPGSVIGSAGLLFQGHPGHDFGDGAGAQEIPVPNTVTYAAVTGAATVARREVASVSKCDTCHYQLNAHGNNRVESVQACAFCHNPNATDVVVRAGLAITPASPSPLDGLPEQSIDLKVMIHAIHASAYRSSQGAVPYVVYHRGSPSNFSAETPFPGQLNNCLACHATDTYYPPDPTTATALSTTTSTYVSGVSSLTTPLGQTAVTAGAAVCSSCHTTALAHTHMVQNGANFAATKDVLSHVVSTETCTICHGPGALADVKLVHNVAALQ